MEQRSVTFDALSCVLAGGPYIFSLGPPGYLYRKATLGFDTVAVQNQCSRINAGGHCCLVLQGPGYVDAGTAAVPLYF